MDCIQPGSSVHGILQARILKWVAIPFQEIFLGRSRVDPWVSCISRQILCSLSHQGSPLPVVVVWALSRVQLLWPHGLSSARLLCPWDSPGKNTGVVSHFLLQWSSRTNSQLKNGQTEVRHRVRYVGGGTELPRSLKCASLSNISMCSPVKELLARHF